MKYPAYNEVLPDLQKEKENMILCWEKICAEIDFNMAQMFRISKDIKGLIVSMSKDLKSWDIDCHNEEVSREP